MSRKTGGIRCGTQQFRCAYMARKFIFDFTLERYAIMAPPSESLYDDTSDPARLYVQLSQDDRNLPHPYQEI